MNTSILWIERGNNSSHFQAGLRKKGFLVTTATSGKAALAVSENSQPDLFVIHIASLKTSGSRIVNRLREKRTPILIIAPQALSTDEASTAEVLVLPFSVRKLVNRVTRLTGTGEQRLSRGPLVIDLEYHTLQLNGNRSDLTPRTQRLLQILLEHPGEVIPREQLYRTVWDTDYVKDLRSLDVHMSWLRKALGEGHQHLLKTIRGVGYRLDI